ncbi:tetratricopeptide repeat protein [Pseudanabaena sp. PCC 6802]|uniref:tetratricopeptide repeat protein n=1 Tax=Pseudanabaena sp. PCC 6802 TaxID=118173 RepID=UPI00034BA9DE|nr:tetratricopeptide repeat protein [Pseudanabaena sp. PCC 6802]
MSETKNLGTEDVQKNGERISIQQLIQEGIQLSQDRQLEAAIAKFDVALDMDSYLYEVWNERGVVLELSGRYDDAIASYDKALAANSEYAQAWYNRGNALSYLDRHEEAIASYDKALASRPGFYEAWYNRALGLEKLGQYEQAIGSYRKVIGLNPDFYDAWNNLGINLERLNRHQEAIAFYDRSIAIYPDFYIAWYNLGNTLRILERHDDAINCYEHAIAIEPNYPEAYCNLGLTLEQVHKLEPAIASYQQALALRPDYPEVRKNLSLLHLKLVPRWHFAMLNDRQRSDRYDRSIAKLVEPNSVVLDIGSGSGLLAMMAARAGAQQVISCEVVLPIADIAREIVRVNGLSDRIAIVNKKSTNMVVGIHMPTKADLLVCEIFDVGLLGEDAIATIKHARSHLLKPDAKILPQRARVYGVLVESPQLLDEDRVQTVTGFDVSLFNTFSSTPAYLQRQLHHYPHKVLSEVFAVFDFDFAGEDIQSEERTIDVRAIADGEAQAVVFWFRLYLDDEIFIDTAPEADSHWMQAVQLLETRLQVSQGEAYTLLASHDCRNIWFGNLR